MNLVYAHATQTFEIQCEIGVDAMNRNRPHDWTVTVCVDGRTVIHTTMSHTSTRASTVTVDCMTFMEGGVAYEGQLKFANLVCRAAASAMCTKLKSRGPPMMKRQSRSAVLNCRLWARSASTSAGGKLGSPWIRPRWAALSNRISVWHQRRVKST